MTDPGDSYDPYAAGAASRVQAPAIVLLIVGVLNLLGALGLIGMGILILGMSPQQLQQGQANNPFGMNQQSTPEEVRLGGIIYLGLGAAAVLGSIFTVWGSTRMLARRGYVLAVTGAVAAIVPCVSPTSCCLLGIAAGIWALVVLLNADVRSAFE